MLEEIAMNLVDDDNLRAIVLAGNGPAFSAGHDLKELVSAFVYSRCHSRCCCRRLNVDRSIIEKYLTFARK